MVNARRPGQQRLPVLFTKRGGRVGIRSSVYGAGLTNGGFALWIISWRGDHFSYDFTSLT